MKKTYFNREERSYVVTLATMATWSDLLAEKLDKPAYKQRARRMENHANKLMEALCASLEEDAFKGLVSYINTHDVAILPKDKAKSSKEYVVLEADDFDFIMSRVFADCETCLNSPAEVKRCRMKKILLKAGAIPGNTPRGECPFMP